MIKVNMDKNNVNAGTVAAPAYIQAPRLWQQNSIVILPNLILSSNITKLMGKADTLTLVLLSPAAELLQKVLRRKL